MSPKKPINPGNLERFKLRHKQTNITVFSDIDLRLEAAEFLEKTYGELEAYCQKEPLFLISYDPLKPIGNEPDIVKIMLESGLSAGVGPMAAVAGAFCELTGRFMLENHAREVIVENGGDIFMKTCREQIINIYAGKSDFSDKIGFKIRPYETPLSVCTSSSSVGHSISLGDSDAVCVVAELCPLADASATSIGNIVKGKEGMIKGIEKAKTINRIKGTLILRGNEMSSWGRLPEIVRV